VEATKFEAISMKDAIRKVKQELGKDAVIISTREKEKVLTIGGKPQKIIEVLATAASAAASKGPVPLAASSSVPPMPRTATLPLSSATGSTV
jgi:flagellar biosynthesis protein FlhF